MASRSRDESIDDVEISYEADTALFTARDLATGVASCGRTRSEALAMLAEALELHEGGGEAVTDEDLHEWGLDSDEFDDEPLPDFLRYGRMGRPSFSGHEIASVLTRFGYVPVDRTGGHL